MPSLDPDDSLRPSLGTPAASSPARATEALMGPLGLRAGWSMLLFLVVATLLTVLGTALIASVTGQGPAMRAQQAAQVAATREAHQGHAPAAMHEVSFPFQLIGETGLVSGLLLAALGLGLLERRRFGVYGLGRKHLRDLAPGAAWGLVSMGILIACLRGFHLLVLERRLLHGQAALRFGLAWLAVFLLVGIGEEFLFRGFAQFTLMRGLLGLGRQLLPERARLVAFWMAGVLFSLLFFAAHTMNGGETGPGLAAVFLAGLLFSYALWRTGSLWWGIGFHASWDWTQSFLCGVPDSGELSTGRLFATHPVGRPWLSGGVDGPEGSVFVLLIFLLMFYVLWRRPQAEQPPVEPLSLPAAPGDGEDRVVP